MLLTYIMENITVIILKENFVQWYQPPYKSFLYPWLQIFGIIVCFGILMFMGKIVAISISGAFALGSAVYVLYGKEELPEKVSCALGGAGSI